MAMNAIDRGQLEYELDLVGHFERMLVQAVHYEAIGSEAAAYCFRRAMEIEEELEAYGLRVEVK